MSFWTILGFWLSLLEPTCLCSSHWLFSLTLDFICRLILLRPWPSPVENSLWAYKQEQLEIPAFTLTREVASMERIPQGSWGLYLVPFWGPWVRYPPITKNLKTTSSSQPRTGKVTMVSSGTLPLGLKVNGSNQSQLLHQTLPLHTDTTTCSLCWHHQRSELSRSIPALSAWNISSHTSFQRGFEPLFAEQKIRTLSIKSLALLGRLSEAQVDAEASEHTVLSTHLTLQRNMLITQHPGSSGEQAS